MTTDAWLAIGHHLAVFGILAVLVAEWSLVRPGMGLAEARLVARIDSAYGALAVAVLAIGASRVAWGAKPADFYLDSAMFWAKMNAFLVVGLLSIWPTIRYLRWRKLDEAPTEGEVRTARRFVHLQLAVFVAIPVLAALMARGIGQ